MTTEQRAVQAAQDRYCSLVLELDKVYEEVGKLDAYEGLIEKLEAFTSSQTAYELLRGIEAIGNDEYPHDTEAAENEMERGIGVLGDEEDAQAADDDEHFTHCPRGAHA